MRSQIALCLTILFAGCSLFAEPLKVAVTQPFYAEWVEQIGGDAVETVLITKDDIDAVKGAEILYETGLGQEPWLDAAMENVKAKPRRVVLTDGMITMKQGEPYWASMPLPHPNPDRMPECCKKGAIETNAAWQKLVAAMPEQSVSGDAVDPNLWYSPLNAQSAVLVISDTLYEALPDNARELETNTAQYLVELENLDEWIGSQVSTIPAEQRMLVTDDGSFRYFAKQYGLIAPSANEASFRQALVEDGDAQTPLAEYERILFTQPSQQGIMQGPENYIDLMRWNTAVLTKQLSTQPSEG